MGGSNYFGLPTDDVYSWDLRNDRVTHRNRLLVIICDMVIVVSGNKIYGVSGVRCKIGYNDSWSNNHETFCYCINDDSWNILPQARYNNLTSISLITLGEFIYAMASFNTYINRLNTSVPLAV